MTDPDQHIHIHLHTGTSGESFAQPPRQEVEESEVQANAEPAEHAVKRPVYPVLIVLLSFVLCPVCSAITYLVAEPAIAIATGGCVSIIVFMVGLLTAALSGWIKMPRIGPSLNDSEEGGAHGGGHAH